MANGTEQITIQGKTFRVPLRYSAGHVLKDNEASALNQTLHENLRNNFAKKVADGIEAGTELSVLQQQLDDYASEYEFGVRTGGGGGFRGDPVMTTAMNIARELIRGVIKEKKLNEDDWPATKISASAKALLESQGENGSIVTAAKQQVEAEKAAASATMAQINDMMSQPAA